jgi:hypothetical protein
VTKTIGDNHRIYSLIIILNAEIVVSIRCGLFKMSNISHLTMLLPNNNNHGCFTLMSMYRFFSTKFSIALMNVKVFFKCTEVAISWAFWINCESVCARVCFFLETWLHASHSSDIRNTSIFRRCWKRSIFKYFLKSPKKRKIRVSLKNLRVCHYYDASSWTCMETTCCLPIAFWIRMQKKYLVIFL